jgi:hypothetical protein
LPAIVQLRIVTLPPDATSWVAEVLVTQGDDILYRTETYTEPFAWARYNPTRHKERIETTPSFGK